MNEWMIYETTASRQHATRWCGYKIALDMEKDFTLFLTSTVKTSSIMKLAFLLSFCVSIQFVSGFTFPSPTLVPITELTEPKVIQVSREELLSSLRQLRLSFMKNLQVISKFQKYLLDTLFLPIICRWRGNESKDSTEFQEDPIFPNSNPIKGFRHRLLHSSYEEIKVLFFPSQFYKSLMWKNTDTECRFRNPDHHLPRTAIKKDFSLSPPNDVFRI